MAGPAHIGTNLLVDVSGRIYALATFRPEDRLDVWLQAFSPAGRPLWPNALQLNEGLGEFPGALWLAPDGALRVYWAARSNMPLDLVLADVSADDGSATPRHAALSKMSVSPYVTFAVDPQGAVVVCAHMLMGERRLLWMQKFSWQGEPVWAKEVLEEAEDTLQCQAVAVDRNGNVAVAGALSDARTRVWLRLYAPDGHRLWRTPVIYDGRYEAFATGLGFDGEGNVVAVGARLSAQNYSYLWLAKYAR